MKLEFTKSVDTEHEIKLESRIVSAEWTVGVAYGGLPASFVVHTELVGYGAPIKVTGKSAKGKKLGKIKGVVADNVFKGSLTAPEDISLGDEVFFEASLPKHSLNAESESIPARPPIEVTNLKWSAAEARRGDVLTLTADVKNVLDDTPAVITIYEHDQDSAHDRIVELPVTIVGEKAELDWEYEYHEDTDEIPTEDELQKYGNSYNPPEYFFTLKVCEFEFGKEQESGLLLFKDWIEVSLANPMGKESYTLTLPDNSTREGKFDSEGRMREDGIPPGPILVQIKEEE